MIGDGGAPAPAVTTREGRPSPEALVAYPVILEARWA